MTSPELAGTSAVKAVKFRSPATVSDLFYECRGVNAFSRHPTCRGFFPSLLRFDSSGTLGGLLELKVLQCLEV